MKGGTGEEKPADTKKRFLISKIFFWKPLRLIFICFFILQAGNEHFFAVFWLDTEPNCGEKFLWTGQSLGTKNCLCRRKVCGSRIVRATGDSATSIKIAGSFLFI